MAQTLKSRQVNYHKWVGFVIVGLAIALGAYWFFKPKQTPPSYITADVALGNIEDSVLASGKIKAISSVDVGAQVSGEVTKLYVKVGDVVKQGDLIAQIDQVTQENNLSNAQASLDQAVATLEQNKATLATRLSEVESAKATISVRESELAKAQSYYERLAGLVEIDAIAKKDYDDSFADLQVAKANLHSAKIALTTAQDSVISAKASINSQEAAIKKAQNDLSTAKKNLGYTTIVAPMAGTVVAVVTEQGTTVNANQSAPTIVTLADLSRVRINAQISEADVINIKAGMPAKFNIIGEPNQKFDATLVGVEPAPEEISDTSSTDGAVYYIGYLDVDNAEGKFRIDMTAQVDIIVNQAKDVLTIPSSAISTVDGKKQVKVVGADGMAHPVDVQVGLDNRINAEIQSGLKQGDKVVIGESSGTTDAKKSNNNRPPMM